MEGGRQVRFIFTRASKRMSGVFKSMVGDGRSCGNRRDGDVDFDRALTGLRSVTTRYGQLRALADSGLFEPSDYMQENVALCCEASHFMSHIDSVLVAQQAAYLMLLSERGGASLSSPNARYEAL